jgi:hypothetical protein
MDVAAPDVANGVATLAKGEEGTLLLVGGEPLALEDVSPNRDVLVRATYVGGAPVDLKVHP